MKPAEEVVAAALDRADALASGDSTRLRSLLHRDFHWTSHQGDQFDRDHYISSNTNGSVPWKAQTLTDIHVTVVANTAVLRCVVTDQVGTELFRMPMTQTWVQTSDGWQCLAGHAGPRQ